MKNSKIRIGRYLSILCLHATVCCPWASATQAVGVFPALPAAVLRTVTPAGYKVDAVIGLSKTGGGSRQYLLALSDQIADESNAAQIPEKVPMVLLARMDRELVVQDQVLLHSSGEGEAGNTPNFFTKMSAEDVGVGKLYLLTSMQFGGGSGSEHFFDFYRVHNDKLQLMKSFLHGRMQQPYFAIYKNAIYDGKLHCERGEKHGKAYTYTCRIDVTKYVYDGVAVRAIGTQPMRIRQGNRYLSDSYWFVSVSKALRNKEIFSEAAMATK